MGHARLCSLAAAGRDIQEGCVKAPDGRTIPAHAQKGYNFKAAVDLACTWACMHKSQGDKGTKRKTLIPAVLPETFTDGELLKDMRCAKQS